MGGASRRNTLMKQAQTPAVPQPKRIKTNFPETKNVIVPGTTIQVHIERNNKNTKWRFYNSNNAKKYELLNRNTETPRIRNINNVGSGNIFNRKTEPASARQTTTGSVNQRVAKKVANTLVWHARKGKFTGIWSPNKIVSTMNTRREVPTNYSNALKENIKTKINARTNINNDRKKRAVGALNVLFTKKPELRPEPEANLNFSTYNNPTYESSTKNNKNKNAATQSYRQHRETYGN
jgi:hypothetical protein